MAEVERLLDSSEIFILNASAVSIDIYVNYEAQPTISDPKPLVGDFASTDELTPTVFVVKGDTARPYGAYTFSARLKGDPDGEVLAAASINLEQGKSFAGAFHQTATGAYQFSIYANDLSPGSGARLTVRHTARTATASWKITPKSGQSPEIPSDEREGALQNAQWQIATGVTDDDYIIEFFVDGQRVALFPDLDLAAEKNIIVYLIGDPQPISDEQMLLRPVAFQELEFDHGPAADNVTSPPMEPLSVSDTNAPIEFECSSVEVWETNSASTSITAVDPDGVVTDLSIDSVTPKTDGFTIADHGVTPSDGIGQPATAEVSIKNDVPDGSYVVKVAANTNNLGQKGSCSLDVLVKPITVARLKAQVSRFERSGAIDIEFAAMLQGLLDDVNRQLADSNTQDACLGLKTFLDRIESNKHTKIANVAAADALIREGDALRTDLECG